MRPQRTSNRDVLVLLADMLYSCCWLRSVGIGWMICTVV